MGCVSSRQRIGIAGLVLFSVATLVMTMTISDADSFHGPLSRAIRVVLRHFYLEKWFGKGQFEFAANILMFVPLGFFLGLTLPRGKFLNGIVAIPMITAFIEAAQYFLPTRGTQFEDVLANSVGGWIGIGAAWLIVVVLERPRRTDPPQSLEAVDKPK